MPVPALRLYTPAEARTVLHVSATELRRIAAARKVTVITTPGGHRRYLAAEVNAISRDAT